jgi:hypothetical protein
MNFQFYLEKLFDSEHFQKFIKENKDAYPVSGFFVIDKEGKDNQQHLDYFVPSTNKLFSFQLEKECELMPMDKLEDNFKSGKLAANYNFDFNDVESLIQKEMAAKGVTNKIQKMLFSLQHKDSKDYLIGTVFISGFGIIKINIDITDMKVILFEKKSFFDMLRITKSKKEEEK